MSDHNHSTPDAPETDYAVGYGRPPQHTRFKPGQSGNRRGRPKGTVNLKTDLVEELGEKVLIREGEKSRPVSKQRAVVKALVSRTLKGDARAASLLMSMMLRLLDTGEGAPEVTVPLQDDERAILEAFEQRIRRSGEGESEPPVDPKSDPSPGGTS